MPPLQKEKKGRIMQHHAQTKIKEGKRTHAAGHTPQDSRDN
jgi:hypothetical protein